MRYTSTQLDNKVRGLRYDFERTLEEMTEIINDLQEQNADLRERIDELEE
jgi:exonuclease VII small subunit